MRQNPCQGCLDQPFKRGAYHASSPEGDYDLQDQYDKIRNERFMRISVEKADYAGVYGNLRLKILTDLEMSIDRQSSILKKKDPRAFMAEDIYFHSIFYYAVKKGYCHQVLWPIPDTIIGCAFLLWLKKE